MRFKNAVQLMTSHWADARDSGEPVATPPLFLGKPGIGKCLGRGTPVLMADGRQLAVEDVQEGDRLMGPDGTARIVSGVTSGRAPMFRIIPNKGEPWTCNNVHILTLVSTDTGEVFDMPLNDFLGMNKTFQERSKQFFVGVEHFENEQTIQPHEVSPYFLGVWMGDGTKAFRSLADGSRVLDGVCITKDDPHLISELQKVAQKWGTQLNDVSSPDRCGTWRFSTSPNEPNALLSAMRELVNEDGGFNFKYLTAPVHQRLELLAGLLDTDGSLTSGTFEITQKRKVYADVVYFLARSCGLLSTCKQKEVDGSIYWRVHISGDIDRIPTRLPHKQASPRKQTKDVTRTGFTVEPLGEGDYFGFTVDKDGRFLLGDFTVTHNTSSGKEAANAMTRIMRGLNGPDYPEALFLALDLSSMLPEDLGGIPKVEPQGDKMVTSFAVQKKLAPFCEEGAYGVLVLDDITQAAPAVQVAARQTVLFRTIGDYKLARDVFLMVTGNRREDKSNASTLPAHFRNSCGILNIETDLDEWCEWYGKQEKHNPVIASFLRYRPSHLAKTPADADQAGAFATPRSWAKLGRTMDTTPADVLLEWMQGLVGEGVAVELRSFMNTRAQLVDPAAVLADPEKALPNPGVLDSPDKAFAMITGLGEISAMRRVAADKKGDTRAIVECGRQLMRAMSWASKGDGRRSNREYIAVAVSTYTSNGGAINDLVQAARLHRQDPLVASALEFLADLVKNAPK